MTRELVVSGLNYDVRSPHMVAAGHLIKVNTHVTPRAHCAGFFF